MKQKKNKFSRRYTLDVKKIAMMYRDFNIADINFTYWYFNRDIQATMDWLDKCRSGQAHAEMGVEFPQDQNNACNYDCDNCERASECWSYEDVNPIQQRIDDIEESIMFTEDIFRCGHMKKEEFEDKISKYRKQIEEIRASCE